MIAALATTAAYAASPATTQSQPVLPHDAISHVGSSKSPLAGVPQATPARQNTAFMPHPSPTTVASPKPAPSTGGAYAGAAVALGSVPHHHHHKVASPPLAALKAPTPKPHQSAAAAAAEQASKGAAALTPNSNASSSSQSGSDSANQGADALSPISSTTKGQEQAGAYSPAARFASAVSSALG